MYQKNIADENSTYCRFPARTNWLRKKLNLKDLPIYKCKEYNKLLKIVDPKSATMVFPSAHVNSPASMFGHTFIRIDSRLNSKLVSYAINYAANADQNKENGVLFAIKGLFGGYFGIYSFLPYYEKLKEYRDKEHRDIWEYKLNLTEDEVLLMFMHIWEIKDSYSYYYFFDENCSYNMLWLLEIARESIELRKHFFYQVTPLETVFAIEEEGLIKSSSYRPSKRTKLLYYEDKLSDKFAQYSIDMALGKKEPKDMKKNGIISRKDQIFALEASIELGEYYLSKGIIKKDRYLDSNRKIAIARSRLGIIDKKDIKTLINPLKSHRAIRASVGYRYSNLDNFDILIGIRPAYHDLLDSNIGLLKGTQLEFLNIDLKLSNKTDKISIDNLNIVSINSYAKKSKFFTPISWRVNFGQNRYTLSNSLVTALDIGAGRTIDAKIGYAYGLLISGLYYQKDRFASLGAVIGATLYANEYLKYRFEFTQKIYNDKKTQKLFMLGQNFNIKQNLDISFKYDFIDREHLDENRATLRLKYFF